MGLRKTSWLVVSGLTSKTQRVFSLVMRFGTSTKP